MGKQFALLNVQTGERLESDRSRITLGRAIDSDFLIDSAAVGRMHAVITQEGDNFFIEDMSTRNGTWLNDQRVAGRVQIRDGDQIRIADRVYLFRIPGPSQESIDPSELSLGQADPSDDIARHIQQPARDRIDPSTERSRDMEFQLDLNRLLHAAGEVQKLLIPQSNFQIPGYDVFRYCEQPSGVGGDVCDCVTLGNGNKFLYLADIAGKGLPAAIMAAWLVAEVRQVMSRTRELSQGIKQINADFPLDSMKFATLIGVSIEPVTHVATFLDAGAYRPLLYHATDGQVEYATTHLSGNFPLGIDPDFSFQTAQEKVVLGPGDCLILYTDGLVDEFDAQQRPLFQHEDIIETIRQPGLRAAQVGERILKEFRRRLAGRSPRDDFSLVCFGRTVAFPGQSDELRNRAAVQELKRVRQLQLARWGQVDPTVIGRFVAGTANPEEIQRIESEIRKHPELGDLLQLLGELGP